MLNALLEVLTFGPRGTHAVTIGGWTPGLRALLGGQVLPCGCLAGTYQTASGAVTAIVDTAAPQCPHRHDVHRVLWRDPADPVLASAVASRAHRSSV